MPDLCGLFKFRKRESYTFEKMQNLKVQKFFSRLKTVLTPLKIKVNGNQFLVTHPHHHAPNPARNYVLKIRSSIKCRAQTTLDATLVIVGGALSGITPAVAAVARKLGENLSGKSATERLSCLRANERVNIDCGCYLC